MNNAFGWWSSVFGPQTNYPTTTLIRRLKRSNTNDKTICSQNHFSNKRKLIKTIEKYPRLLFAVCSFVDNGSGEAITMVVGDTTESNRCFFLCVCGWMSLSLTRHFNWTEWLNRMKQSIHVHHHSYRCCWRRHRGHLTVAPRFLASITRSYGTSLAEIVFSAALLRSYRGAFFLLRLKFTLLLLLLLLFSLILHSFRQKFFSLLAVCTEHCALFPPNTAFSSYHFR